MQDKKAAKIFDIKEIDLKLDEMEVVESIISDILKNENFYNMNYLQNQHIADKTSLNFKIAPNKNAEFISIDKNSIAPYSNIMSEDEFYKIVGKTKKGLSKKSGKYQKNLYEYYINAVKEQDEGFIADVLVKALIFENNLNYVKHLMKKKKFMKEWQKNFGKKSPADEFKQSGNLKKINIIYDNII